MQVFTESLLLDFTDKFGSLNSHAENTSTRKRHPQSSSRPTPLWPDYFARHGQPDAISWHYAGHWPDTWRIWKTYYRFIAHHPIVAFHGLRQFFASLIYRVFGETIGDHSTLPVALATPLLVALTPVLALLAVSIASTRVLRKKVPPLFQPFTKMGWTNYCIMLSLVFSLHGYRQRQLKLQPSQAMRHSAKTFWNTFFAEHLPENHYPTVIHATCRNGKIDGCLPRNDIILKPVSAGAGHQLRLMRWDAIAKHYVNDNAERAAAEPTTLNTQELKQYLRRAGVDMLVERFEPPRAPLPICTFRVLTLYVGQAPELICVAFLKAPDDSASTAYFDIDAYLLDYQKNQIAEALAPSSNGQLTGTAVPELSSIVETCLSLHEKLPEHAQISWDVIPAARGPIYLEGNVFPPGCDYKLMLFKNDSNFDYLTRRVIKESRRIAEHKGASQ